MTKVAWWIAVLPLFAIPFLALFVPDNLFFPFITGKNFAFRILVEISFAGWLILAFASKEYRPRISWTLILFGAFVAWMFLANLLAVNPHKAFWSNYERMDGWVTLVHLLMFFVVAGSLLAKEILRQNWWRSFIAAAALTCGVALFQVSGALTINQGGVRVDSTFGNAIYFAVFLMFALIVTVWQALSSKGMLRYALIALAIAEALFLFRTASRGAIIAALCAGAFVCAWTVWKASARMRTVAISGLVALVVVVGGFFLARDSAFVQGEPILARLSTTFSMGEELKIRFSIWDMARQGTVERPVTGWGQEGFNYVFTKYYDPALYRAEPYYDRAHNTYLDWLVAGGIPALILFLALLATAALAILRSSLGKGERLMLLALFVAYGVQALVAFDNLFSYVPLVLMLATAHFVSSRPIQKMETAPTVPEQGLGIVVIPAVAAVTVAVFWLVNVPGLVVAGDIIRAQQPTESGLEENYQIFEDALNSNAFATQEVSEHLAMFAARIVSEPSVSNELKARFLTLAIKGLDRELERAPIDVRLLLQRAAVYRAGGDYDNAIRSIDAALALSPNKQTIHLDRAGTLWIMGDKEGARAAFLKAYELDQRFADPLMYLAASEVMGGDIAAAHAVLLDQFGTTTIDSEPLWNAYANTQQYDELLKLQRVRVSVSGYDPNQWFILAQILAVSGRIDEARAEATAILAAYPGAQNEIAQFLAQLPQTP